MKIEGLKISSEKKKPYIPKDEIYLCNMGIEGDRHADGQDKQISVYSIEAAEIDKTEMQGLCYGSYEANLMLSGVDLKALKKGDVLKIGESASVMITSHKGKCFDNCDKFNAKLYCTLRANALYAKVLTEGVVKVGDEIVLEKTYE